MSSAGGEGGTLGIDPALLAVLACPDTHHSPLTVDVEAAELVCGTCSRVITLRVGIPVVLLEDARRRTT